LFFLLTTWTKITQKNSWFIGKSFKLIDKPLQYADIYSCLI